MDNQHPSANCNYASSRQPRRRTVAANSSTQQRRMTQQYRNSQTASDRPNNATQKRVNTSSQPQTPLRGQTSRVQRTQETSHLRSNGGNLRQPVSRYDRPQRVRRHESAPNRTNTQKNRAGAKQLLSGAPAGIQRLALAAFAVILALGFVIGLAFFARPSTSELEKRELTQFPTITIETVLNGEFFTQVSLWYSDTYPLRDPLVAADLSLKSLFGIQSQEQVIGSSQKADELPSESGTLDLESRQSVEMPTEEQMAETIQGQIMGRLYVNDGAAYSVYYFADEAVRQYATAISIAAKRLEGKAAVYSMIVPNNSAVILDDKTLTDLGGTDQAKAIDYFYSLYDPRVKTVSVLDSLRSASGEYRYFRSDHHWTADGAYIAYQQLCERMGIAPVDKSTLETKTFEPFLGTYYSELNNEAMAANPDYVKAYVPSGTNTMTYWKQGDSEEYVTEVIRDVSGWNEASLYNTFISGDQPLSHISNPSITDGSSILLVKDSFGCAFAPWLVNNFQDVWIIDFRYSDLNIVDFASEKGIQNVLFLNNIEIAGTTPVANALTNEVSESQPEQQEPQSGTKEGDSGIDLFWWWPFK